MQEWGIDRKPIDRRFQRHNFQTGVGSSFCYRSLGRVGGKLRELDVSPSDVVWSVNSGHSIYIRLGTRWKKVTGKLKHVSVGNAGVWGVNRFDRIYFREGVTTSNLAGTTWSLISGENILRNNLIREKISDFESMSDTFRNVASLHAML
jgi:hypothetical protein